MAKANVKDYYTLWKAFCDLHTFRELAQTFFNGSVICDILEVNHSTTLMIEMFKKVLERLDVKGNAFDDWLEPLVSLNKEQCGRSAELIEAARSIFENFDKGKAEIIINTY